MTTVANAFMTELWRQDAFTGATPSDAFFVKCDATTNPPAEPQTVTMQVGYAPTQSAEFIPFTIAFAIAM